MVEGQPRKNVSETPISTNKPVVMVPLISTTREE
jgi:hypothetical protein